MDRIGYQIKRVQQLLRAQMDEQLRGLGLTTPQYAALSELERAPGLSSAALARRCFVTAQTMNEIAANLLGRGLLVRHAHPEHGRILQLSLTAQGAELVAQAHLLVAQIEQQMVAPLSAEEQEQLLGYLERCGAALEQE
ncbi:MAG: MarR family transcriptional regulator [Roseiflexaceae bacterium]